MNLVFFVSLITLLWLAPGGTAYAQSLKYDIYIGKRVMGTLEAVCSEKQDKSRQYRLETHIKWPLLHISSLMQATYDAKGMYSASVQQWLNKSLRESSSVAKNSQGYRIEFPMEEKKRSLTGLINYSVSCLYHQEPTRQQSIFSERFGEYCSMKPLGEGRYELTMPDGKKITYTYANGICEQMETRQMGQHVIMKRVSK
ncbi:MAG: hypothetical protein HUU34_22800 [Saprospiraceae bacterium]|nr:hypothetical protein [Saprospiraceae bacterium]